MYIIIIILKNKVCKKRCAGIQVVVKMTAVVIDNTFPAVCFVC